MNETTASGMWDEMKGKIKKAYAELTDDDLKHSEGEADEMYGKIEQKTGHTKDQVNKTIADM